MEIHDKLKSVSAFLSDYSTTLMAVGVQTSRVVKNSSRIAESFGLDVDMTIFQKTIIMTLRDKDNTHSYSTVNKIKPMALNFFINSKLSTLSWDAYDHRLSLEEIRKRYDEIVNVPRESNLIVLILVAIANASFCRLFQGDAIELIENHVSGRLKVAPEHTSDKTLNIMRKPSFSQFKSFKRIFDDINKNTGLKQQIIPYFISSQIGRAHV